MKFEEDYIDRKLTGSLAEQLFELLHFEIGCRVFRTGHEFLYPDLFNLANLKKRLHHKAVLEKDIEYFLKKTVQWVKDNMKDSENGKRDMIENSFMRDFKKALKKHNLEHLSVA